MEIRVKIEKKHAFLIAGALALFALSIFAYAFVDDNTGTPNVMGHSVGEIDWSKALPSLLISPSTNANLRIGKNISLNGAVSISATNDANTTNTPLEIRASKTVFTIGDVCTGTGSSEKCLSVAGSNYFIWDSGWVGASQSCDTKCGVSKGIICKAQNPDGSQMDVACSWSNPGLFGRCVCLVKG